MFVCKNSIRIVILKSLLLQANSTRAPTHLPPLPDAFVNLKATIAHETFGEKTRNH